MAKVITFSRNFPAYHPKKGQPTFFVEQILNCLGCDYANERYLKELLELNAKNIQLKKLTKKDVYEFWLKLDQNIKDEKGQTIRNGKRIKQHDLISYRVWSGKPYNSPQIIFFEFRIIKTFDFEMDLAGVLAINGKYLLDEKQDITLAKNDGFTNYDDLFNWLMPNFDKPTEINGQIICWNPEIKY